MEIIPALKTKPKLRLVGVAWALLLSTTFLAHRSAAIEARAPRRDPSRDLDGRSAQPGHR